MGIDIYKKVGIELGVDENEVKKAYESYWRFARKIISSLPISGGVSKETFDTLKKNFRIKHIGEFFVEYNNYIRCFKNNKSVYENIKVQTNAESCDNDSR